MYRLSSALCVLLYIAFHIELIRKKFFDTGLYTPNYGSYDLVLLFFYIGTVVLAFALMAANSLHVVAGIVDLQRRDLLTPFQSSTFRMLQALAGFDLLVTVYLMIEEWRRHPK